MMVKEKSKLMELFNVDIDFEEDIEDAINHGYIVSNLAFRLARELGYDEEFCNMMADAGLLHDIGKLELSNKMYGRQKNVLKIEEMKYVRRHPSIGYQRLCDENVGTEELRQIVLHHHENFDGSGYPNNTKGTAIPLGSRILRVCDVYSALISDRPYRPAFDRNTAMELMIEEVKNFDMEVFLAFMRIVHEDDFEDILNFVDKVNANKHYDYDLLQF